MALDYHIIGKRIKERRKAMGLTQEKFAERANRSPAFIGHIERGTRIMSLETLCEIATALDCSSDELLGLELKNNDAYATAIDLLEMAQIIARENVTQQSANNRPAP